MSFCNYHTHTKYCDGMDTPEELILEAIRLGCPEIGFSGHSHLPGETWCMTEEETLQYCSEIRRLVPGERVRHRGQRTVDILDGVFVKRAFCGFCLD